MTGTKRPLRLWRLANVSDARVTGETFEQDPAFDLRGVRATGHDQLHHAQRVARRPGIGREGRTHRTVQARYGAGVGVAGEPTRTDSGPACRRATPHRSDIARSPDWREESIGRHHDRKSFDCGSPVFNDYLIRYARQNHESGGAKTFVAVSPTESARVPGDYSISPGVIAFARVSTESTRKLGRYDVPVFRLGRLAVDLSVQGQGLGGELLLAAGERASAVAAEVGGTALAIDAKDGNAARWYERFGALRCWMSRSSWCSRSSSLPMRYGRPGCSTGEPRRRRGRAPASVPFPRYGKSGALRREKRRLDRRGTRSRSRSTSG